MKKKLFISLMLITVTSFSVFAQNWSRIVDQAASAHKDGNLVEAKAKIDQAMQSPEAQKEAKAWYYKGLIYESLMASDNSQFRALSPNAPEITYEAYQKTMDLSKSGSVYSGYATLRMDGLWGILINKGAAEYQDGKYDDALKSFIAATKYKDDTLANLYAAYSAKAAKDKDAAEKYFRKTIDLGSKDWENYLDLINVVRGDNDPKGLAKAIDIMKEAREEHPENTTLMKTEINLYLLANRGDEVIDKVTKAIDVDPQNADLYFTLGTIYEQKKDYNSAVKNYGKAIEIKPDHFDANYNLGVVYYNQGAEFTQKLNAMDLSTYQREGKKVEKQAKETFEKALPYFEKAYSINPKDKILVQSLATVYSYLKMSDKADKMKKEAESL